MSDKMKPHVGDPVVYIDERRLPHPALITAVWGDDCINLVYVSGDESRQDSHGRQVERESSCCHMRTFERRVGNFWRFNDENPEIDTDPPEEV